jgi:hypothetical protein
MWGEGFIKCWSLSRQKGWLVDDLEKDIRRTWTAVFATSGVIVLGLDDTIERRRGKQIASRSKTSSDSQMVKI